jgi:hypothetical protein
LIGFGSCQLRNKTKTLESDANMTPDKQAATDHNSKQISFVVATPEQVQQLGGASDGALLIYDGAILLGWADDYGSVTHPDQEITADIKVAAEAAVQAVGDLLAALMLPDKRSTTTSDSHDDSSPVAGDNDEAASVTSIDSVPVEHGERCDIGVHAAISWTYIGGERAEESLLHIRKALKKPRGWWAGHDTDDYINIVGGD